IYSIINEEPPDLGDLVTDVPPELIQMVKKTLSKDRNQRYQTIDELLEDFQPLSSEAATLIHEPLTKTITRLWRRKKTRQWVISLGGILLLVITLLICRPFIFKDLLQAKPVPIAIINFENQTGDSSYNYLRSAIPNLLITSLEQSSGLQVTTQERMRELLKQMGREEKTIIDAEIGFEVCRREGVQRMLIGSIIQAGDMFATNIKVLDTNTKELLGSASAKGKGVESLLENQIDELSYQISQGLGLSEEKIEQEQRSVTEMITDSWEAYTYYQKSMEYSEKFYWKEVLQMLELAVQADTTFALAWFALAEHYWGDKKEQALEIAERHKHKIPEKERLYAEAWDYAGSNIEKADSIYRLLSQRYPRESRAHQGLGTLYYMNGFNDKAFEQYNLVIELDPSNHHAWNNLGYIYSSRGEFDKAIECMKKYVQNSPGDANPFDSMGEVYLEIGDIDEAIRTFMKAEAVKSDWNEDINLAYCYALQEDYAEAVRYIDNVGKPGLGSTGFYNVVMGIYQYFQGRRSEAMKNMERVTQILDSAGISSVNEFRAENLRSWIYYERRDFEAGRISSEKATDYFIDKNEEKSLRLYYQARHALYLGLVHLQENRPDSARSYLTQLGHHIKEHQAFLKKGQRSTRLEITQYYYDLLSAEILLKERKIREAIRQAEKIPEYKNLTLSAVYLFYLNFPPRNDVKARVYYQAGKLDKAIKEYERMSLFDKEHLDRRLIPAKFHYRLAQLYEEKGQKQKAIDRYKYFLKVWKDADPDIPELIDAKKRLVALGEQNRVIIFFCQ
ncbi:MAG: tetratricopeptide repeat protein, partial [Calditrichia bacterium]|nr:tetratricopeptide repeat protein [Calditrichia bacterium]